MPTGRSSSGSRRLRRWRSRVVTRCRSWPSRPEVQATDSGLVLGRPPGGSLRGRSRATGRPRLCRPPGWTHRAARLYGALMRPIPAPRLGDAHGLLRAIGERERLRLDEFVTEFTLEELFPPGLENALGRTRQFVSFARSAGLLNEDRGTVELTDMGKRYVRAGDASKPFDVAPAQAEWLRRLLRERHMTDSIFHGAAVGLSLYASNPPDFRASMVDFGRALNYLGRAGWDSENTFQSQGERYTTFLADLELVDSEPRPDAHGPADARRADAADPHVAEGPRGPAEPRRAGGGRAGGRGGVGGGAAPPAAPAPVAEAPAEQAAPASGGEDEYEDVGPGAGPSPAAAPAAAPAAGRRGRPAAAGAASRHLGEHAGRPHAGLPGHRRGAAGGRAAGARRAAGRPPRPLRRPRRRPAAAAAPPPPAPRLAPAARRPEARRARGRRRHDRVAAAPPPRGPRRSSPRPRSGAPPRRRGCACPRACTRPPPRRSRPGTSCSSDRPAAARRRSRWRSRRPPRSPASRPARRS